MPFPATFNVITDTECFGRWTVNVSATGSCLVDADGVRHLKTIRDRHVFASERLQNPLWRDRCSCELNRSAHRASDVCVHRFDKNLLSVSGPAYDDVE